MAIGPMVTSASIRPNVNAPKKTSGPDGRRRDDGEVHLLVGPRDRVEHGDDDRHERQPDHDREEREVAQALAVRHADGEVAQDAGDGDQARGCASTRPSALRTSRSRPSAPMA